MTLKFQASNGVTVSPRGTRTELVLAHADGRSLHLSAERTEALSEFFERAGHAKWQEAEDARLGRWRWRENPDYVVYDQGLDHDGFRYAMAMHEPTGITGKWQEGQTRRPAPTAAQDDLGILAVAAYFEAHPGRKPWHDAKPGEVWVLTDFHGKEHAVNVNDRRGFQFLDGHASYPIDSTAFTAGRRIWPEDAS